MKKLTRKFKEGFKSYDYNDQDIDVLISLLDIILEMMTIVDMSDHDYIKKLSSFTRLLSSGYSNTVLDALIIEEIYDNTIMPVLDYFDEKYSTRFVALTTNEIENGIPHVKISTDERVLRISNDFICDNMDVKKYRKLLIDMMDYSRAEISAGNEATATATKVLGEIQSIDMVNDFIIKLNQFIIDNKDTDDPDILKTIFNMSKDTVGILHDIYDRFTSGKLQERKEKYIECLISLRNTMEIVSEYDQMEIQLIADNMRDLCYALIYELKNDIYPPSSIVMIELKFKALEDINYK